MCWGIGAAVLHRGRVEAASACVEANFDWVVCGLHARDMHAWWGNPCLLCAGGKDQYSGCDGIAVQCNALDPKIGRFARSAPAHDGKVAKCIMP